MIMRSLAALGLLVALAACSTTRPAPQEKVEWIRTIGVIIDPWDEIEVTQGGFDFARRTYSAAEWRLPEAFIGGIRRALAPRYEVIPIPALNIPAEEEHFYLSERWDVDRVVAPSIAAAGITADAYLYLDIQPNFEPIDRTSAPLSGCGVQSIAMMFQDGSIDALYCVAYLRLLEPGAVPGRLEVIGSAKLLSNGYDKAMAAPLENFTWQGVNLTNQQINFLKAAFPYVIRRDIPISLRALGLIE